MVSDIDWESKDINTVYDVFYEKGTRLGGAYNSLRSRAREVGDEDAVRFSSYVARNWSRSTHIELRSPLSTSGPEE